MPPQVNKKDVLVGFVCIVALISAYALAFYMGQR